MLSRFLLFCADRDWCGRRRSFPERNSTALPRSARGLDAPVDFSLLSSLLAKVGTHSKIYFYYFIFFVTGMVRRSAAAEAARAREAAWSETREKHLRFWVVQMLNTSTMLDWSASWMRWFQFAFTTLGQFTQAYTSVIPVATLGCSFSTGRTCSELQWSAVALSVLGCVLAFMDGKYEIGGKAVRMNNASQNIARLARRIDLQLQRVLSSREPVDEFCAAVVREYDEIICTVPDLPRWIRGDLTNITLLTAYREEQEEAPRSREILEKSTAAAGGGDEVAMNPHLRAKMEYELERFESHHQP